MKRIKHNDLTHYFLRDHASLPQAYVRSCEKFFNSLKPQAASSKPQASKPQAACDNLTHLHRKKII